MFYSIDDDYLHVTSTNTADILIDVADILVKLTVELINARVQHIKVMHISTF